MDLAIDGGQTGLRLGLATGGRSRKVHEGPGLSYAEGSPVEAVLAPGSATAGATSTADLPRPDHHARRRPEELAARLLVMARGGVVITTDVVTSHAGAFAGGRASCWRRAPARSPWAWRGVRTRPAGGRWGYLCGDAGGG